MRKIIAILVAMAMAAVFAPMVGADGVEQINVTLNPQGTISITVNQSEWLPDCGLGETNATTETWANIVNSGDVHVQVNVTAEDSEDWTIETAAGHNQFSMNITGTNPKALTDAAQVWLADLPDEGDPGVDCGLQVAMPTSSSTNDQQYVTITFTATPK